MIDSHAHILSEYYENIDKLVEELKNNKVINVLNCSTSYEEAKEIIELSKNFNGFFLPAIGIHPENVENNNIDEIENIIKSNKVYALGEIGLDYHYRKDNKEQQKELFIKQLDLALKYDLPVVVHTRESIQDCYDILKEKKVRGVIHCFSGSYEMACNFIKLGFKLGIGGVLTFKNSKLGEVIEKLDLKDILLETDSPFLSPEPLRGKKNNPSNIYYVAKKISEIKNIDVDTVITQTTSNFIHYFDI